MVAMTDKQRIDALRARMEKLTGEPGHVMTAEEIVEFDALELAIKAMETPRTTGRRTAHSQPSDAALGRADLSLDRHHVVPGATAAPAGRRSYQSIFRLSGPLDDAGFDDAHDFFKSVAIRDHQRFASTHSENVMSKGGFAVPELFAANLINQTLEDSVVLSRARIVPMESESLSTAVFDDSDHSAGQTYGGLYGSWTIETGAIAYKTATLHRLKLTAHKLAMLTKASSELLADAPSFESTFLQRIRDTMSWSLDDAFLNGTGAGMPKGILSDSALITVSKESGQAAATINWTNLTKMFARLYPPSMPNAVWVCSTTCLPQLLSLSIPVGTGGSHVPVMQGGPNNLTILGRPVAFTEKAKTLGTLGDVMLVDFSRYVIGMRRNALTVDRSEHVAFQSDEVVWRTTLRCDGMGSWKSAFTPRNGDSQSWCVALQTRS